jgi:hypothetical protein
MNTIIKNLPNEKPINNNPKKRKRTQALLDDINQLKVRRVTKKNKYEHIKDFKCPISKMFMRDPALYTDGHFYERNCIEEWSKKSDISPMTGKTVHPKTIIDSFYMRRLIDDEMKLNPHLLEEKYNILKDFTKYRLNVFDHIRNKQFDRLLDYKNFELSETQYLHGTQLKFIDSLLNALEKSSISPTSKTPSTRVLIHIIDHCVDFDNEILVKISKDHLTDDEIKSLLNNKSTLSKPVKPFIILSDHIDINFEFLKYIIQNKKIDPNCRNADGYTPLYIFSAHLSSLLNKSELSNNIPIILEILKLLIEKGADNAITSRFNNNLPASVLSTVQPKLSAIGLEKKNIICKALEYLVPSNEKILNNIGNHASILKIFLFSTKFIIDWLLKNRNISLNTKYNGKYIYEIALYYSTFDTIIYLHEMTNKETLEPMLELMLKPIKFNDPLISGILKHNKMLNCEEKIKCLKMFNLIN